MDQNKSCPRFWSGHQVPSPKVSIFSTLDLMDLAVFFSFLYFSQFFCQNMLSVACRSTWISKDSTLLAMAAPHASVTLEISMSPLPPQYQIMVTNHGLYWLFMVMFDLHWETLQTLLPPPCSPATGTLRVACIHWLEPTTWLHPL